MAIILRHFIGLIFAGIICGVMDKHLNAMKIQVYYGVTNMALKKPGKKSEK